MPIPSVGAAMFGIFPSRSERFSLYYDLGSMIRKGSFAVVMKGKRKSDQTYWAIKIVKRKFLSADDEQSLLSEVSIMERLHHPNIVQMREYFDCPRHMYLVMELLTGGQLYDRVIAKGHYSEYEARIAFRQIISALSYCHGLGIVHRDIKPENIIYCNPEEGSPLKLTDFGFAQHLKPGELLHNACGTPMYVAPDMLRRDHSGYGREVDLWSAGVVLFIMISGYPPFFDDDDTKLLSHIQSGEYEFQSPYWDAVSPLCKDLIEKLLVVDPSTRLTATQTEFHPWMIETSHLVHLQSQSSVITEGSNTISRVLSSIRSRFLPTSRSNSIGV